MLYCSSECGAISIMHGYAQFIATRMYIHFMCAYVYLHLPLFVIQLFIAIEMLISNISKKAL